MKAFWRWLCSLFPWLSPKKPEVPKVVVQLWTIYFEVYGVGDQKVPNAVLEVDVAAGQPHVCATANGEGNATMQVPAGLTASHLWATADGFNALSMHLDLVDGAHIQVHMTPPFVPLPRIRVRGQFFELEDGTHWTAIECSDFNLLNRWQHGEDIRPILQERSDLGFNLLRVWTLYDLAAANIGVFLDIDYGRVGDFLDLCATYDLYVEFTAYTSTERVDHWDKLVAAVQGKTNVLLELVNEEDQSANKLAHLAEYKRPTGVLASHGSNGAEKWPVQPYWDYVTFHTNGASQEQRKIGHNAWEIWGGPSLTNETSRYPEVGVWRGASLDRCKQLAFDSAAGAALLCAGSCFHSVAGKASVLFDANTLAVAQAWVAGAKSVDLACQAGPYKHRADLEGSTYLRVYERPVSGHDGIVRIRP